MEFDQANVEKRAEWLSIAELADLWTPLPVDWQGHDRGAANDDVDL
jgi:hypothetical protein